MVTEARNTVLVARSAGEANPAEARNVVLVARSSGEANPPEARNVVMVVRWTDTGAPPSGGGGLINWLGSRRRRRIQLAAAFVAVLAWGLQADGDEWDLEDDSGVWELEAAP